MGNILSLFLQKLQWSVRWSSAQQKLVVFCLPGAAWKQSVMGVFPVACSLLQVAAYDFILPVMVNNKDSASPPLSPWPPSHSQSQVTLGSKREFISSCIQVTWMSVPYQTNSSSWTVPCFEDTPKRRVLATGLATPLSVTDTRLELKSLPKVWK